MQKFQNKFYVIIEIKEEYKEYNKLDNEFINKFYYLYKNIINTQTEYINNLIFLFKNFETLSKNEIDNLLKLTENENIKWKAKYLN